MPVIRVPFSPVYQPHSFSKAHVFSQPSFFITKPIKNFEWSEIFQTYKLGRHNFMNTGKVVLKKQILVHPWYIAIRLAIVPVSTAYLYTSFPKGGVKKVYTMN